MERGTDIDIDSGVDEDREKTRHGDRERERGDVVRSSKRNRARDNGVK